MNDKKLNQSIITCPRCKGEDKTCATCQCLGFILVNHIEVPVSIGGSKTLNHVHYPR